MSASDSVAATLVMLPASLVRRRALKSASCFLMYCGHWPATRRNLVLPDKAAEVAHRTEDRVGSLPAGLDLGGIHLEFDRGLFLRGEKLAQQRHVLGRELLPPAKRCVLRRPT